LGQFLKELSVPEYRIIAHNIRQHFVEFNFTDSNLSRKHAITRKDIHIIEAVDLFLLFDNNVGHIRMPKADKSAYRKIIEKYILSGCHYFQGQVKLSQQYPTANKELTLSIAKQFDYDAYIDFCLSEIEAIPTKEKEKNK
jgi:hypothetical protein